MKKTVKVIFTLSIILNAVTLGTFGYLWASDKAIQKSEEDEFVVPQDRWMVSLELNVPDLEPHVVQFAFLDEDPTPSFLNRVDDAADIYFMLQERAETEEQKHIYRSANIRNSWDDAFMNVTGDNIHLLHKSGSRSSNALPSTQWVVTKVVYLDNEPLCWCIPVEPEFGQRMSISLNKDNAYNISEEFDKAIQSRPDEQDTKFPFNPDFKDEPKAHKIYTQMIKAFQSARSVYYESRYWQGREGEKFSEAEYRVWLKKPNYARIEASRRNAVTGTLVGDSENFWIYWGDRHMTFEGDDFAAYGNKTYMLKPSPSGRHSLAHMVDQLRAHIIMLVFEPSRFHGGKGSLDEHLDGVRSHGTDAVNGIMCDVIEVSFYGNQRSKYYWISRDDCLPRKMMEVVRVDVTYIAREVWTNVFVNVDIPDYLFNWTPPVGWEEYVNIDPDWKENLLKPGTRAPDFELKTIEGTEIKLFDLRGNVVLLNFWRVGCAPCRDEILYLEDLYRKHKDTDLVVLGINASDDQDIAVRFLRDNNITYPNVIDASPHVQNLQFHVYEVSSGRSAVPMNYIIDRDGIIADAWYGHDEDDDSPENRLKPFGFE
jgi:peroxiredoxin/outer membrane lipoprotein-sorting protein